MVHAVNGMTVASASVYPVTTHWIVARVVPKSRASALMATLTTVASRIDMMAPMTTTDETSSSRRSSGLGAAGARRHSPRPRAGPGPRAAPLLRA
jgi:hypothetical protein